MDRKEELVLKHCDKSSTFCHIDESQFIIDGSGYPIVEAMDEYAKEQAIAFDDWTAYNHVKYQKGHKWVCADKIYEQPPTTEQLYAQFIEHQQSK